MDNQHNLCIYRLWSPVYDTLFKAISHGGRQRAVALLDLKPGEKLLIPGIGTGLDLLYLPAAITVVGGDLSPAMLAKARAKAAGRDVTLCEMDAQKLDFPDASFDAALFSLLLSVVPDGAAALREGWRVLRPGGRVVIFDKFLPEQARLTPARQLIGGLIRSLGTDPNRRLSDLLRGLPGLTLSYDEPNLFGGQYRVIRLDKA
ncbi:MAG: methyltransferase domain-containing protein [Chloroflexi bacterium]|nr:methyltransferase domain-containing protein [Chloroflexota bacterium]